MLFYDNQCLILIEVLHKLAAYRTNMYREDDNLLVCHLTASGFIHGNFYTGTAVILNTSSSAVPPSAPSTIASEADANELSDDTESVAAERKTTYCWMSSSVRRINGTIILSCCNAMLDIIICIAGVTSDEKLRWKTHGQ